MIDAVIMYLFAAVMIGFLLAVLSCTVALPVWLYIQLRKQWIELDKIR